LSAITSATSVSCLRRGQNNGGRKRQWAVKEQSNLRRTYADATCGMRALSIRQPFAELILRGIKTVEYRTRPHRQRRHGGGHPE
jgi:hypothetical protein